MENEKKYREWVKKAADSPICDPDVTEELWRMAEERELREDAFYRELTFGTGGLRGVIGAGTNRMNVYTVARASQGLANYVNRKTEQGTGARRIAISFDSRMKSELFSRVAAEVFAANGIEVYIYSRLMPTPCLSFAVRELGCAAGVMVTASHNPGKYNGYKVYGADGCQITTEAAAAIFEEIEKLDVFDDVKAMDFQAGLETGKIRYISEEVETRFVEAVKSQSVLGEAAADKGIPIIYSPLNGTGLEPVLRTLQESGYTNVSVVKEQEKPDGHFPTCPYPNPEIREAMALGMEYAKQKQASLFLATDPDCDRVGTAVRDERGEYVLLSGNEMGLLLLDYLCSRRIANGTMPKEPVMIKTIVTTDLGERIAAHYGVRTIQVLTGFKFIGEQIGLLEKQGKADSYLFGFEESYGYLSGSYVRDKDAVDGVFLICEMAAYYAAHNTSLLERLNQIYEAYGYSLSTLHSYAFEGMAGFARMQDIMKMFRSGVAELGGKEVLETLDYGQGIGELPKSDVLKFRLEGDASVVIRPSGTEPKMKAYISVSAKNREEAERQEALIVGDLERYFVE